MIDCNILENQCIGENMIIKNFKTLTVAIFITIMLPMATYGIRIGNFEGLDKLIKEADAIVILRIDEQLTRGGLDSYRTYECYIYQTLKGNISANKRIRLQLMNTHFKFVSRYALWSTHLMFLTKKRSKNEPTDYRTLEVEGANVLITPFGNETLPPGKTIKEKIQHILKRTVVHNKKKYEREKTFIASMLRDAPKYSVYKLKPLAAKICSFEGNTEKLYKDLVAIEKYILKQGKISGSSDFCKNKPFCRSSNYEFFLIPETKNPNSHKLVIRDFGGGSRHIEFADKNKITITDLYPSKNLTVEQNWRFVENALNIIMTEIETQHIKVKIPGLNAKLKNSEYAYATSLINTYTNHYYAPTDTNLGRLEKIKEVLKARRKLTVISRKAVPALLDNLERKLHRPLLTAHRPYTKRPLLMIFTYIFDPIGMLYKIREDAKGQKVSGLTYFEGHFQTKQKAETWWKQNQKKSDDEIRIMIRDWYITRETKLGFKDDKQKQEILGKIKRRFAKPNKWK